MTVPLRFLGEPEPPRGVAVPVLEGIRRIVAPNPGPMTYHGTNTYLVETQDGVVVLDPGPDDAGHIAAILREAGGRIAAILLSHGHPDHAAGLARLKAASGAPVHAFRRSAAPGLVPDVGLGGGDTVGGLRALHTPGHASDHLCFASDVGVLFTADHVMGWSTSVVLPPDGDMAAYVAGLARLAERDDRIYLPGHGPPIAEPQAFVRALLAHRQDRERQILEALAEAPSSTAALAAALYPGIAPAVRPGAERNVLAHLLKLEHEGRAVCEPGSWRLR